MIYRNYSKKYGNYEFQPHTNIILSMLLSALLLLTNQCGKDQDKSSVTNIDIKEVVSDSSPVDRNLLRRELYSNPQYLNPVLSNDEFSSLVEELIFESMLSFDSSPESKLVGRLAEKWEISDDKLTITFFLRSDVRWHDGEPFTARDVKFTFDIAKRKDVPAIGMRSLVEPLERIEVVDPCTVKFYFKYAFSPGLFNLGTTLIVPEHHLSTASLKAESEKVKKKKTFSTSDFNKNPIGTGPYVFREWKQSQSLKLTRNENYWDRDHFPKIETILFKIFPNRDVAFDALQKNELDVFRARPVHYTQFHRTKELQQHYVAEMFYEPSFYYIAWNLRSDKRVFNSRLVRTAMTHAIDRETYILKVLQGRGSIVTGPYFFKSWAYDPKIVRIPYSLEKAAGLLQAAGWEDHDGDHVLDKDGIQFEFDLLVPDGNKEYAQLAEYLLRSLKKLSIKMTISLIEWNDYLERTQKGEFDACVGGWGLGIDPDLYDLFHSSQVDIGNNYIGYSNKNVDKLLEEGRREFDRKKRQQIYWKVHKTIHHDQPYSFIYTTKDMYILSKRIKNYQISPFGLFGFFPSQLDWSLE